MREFVLAVALALAAVGSIGSVTSTYAAEELEDVRDELGDVKFDLLFGSANTDEDSAMPEGQRLVRLR
jgi:NTP pyrophosphatase (non-canonical NTP hydrolase)